MARDSKGEGLGGGGSRVLFKIGAGGLRGAEKKICPTTKLTTEGRQPRKGSQSHGWEDDVPG